MVTKGILILAGLIHLIPAVAVLGERSLVMLYELAPMDANVRLLLRHRAVLFALLGLFLIYAAWAPALQSPAIIAGFVSVASFIVLYWLEGPHNAALQKVAVIDAVIALLLVLAALMRRGVGVDA